MYCFSLCKEETPSLLHKQIIDRAARKSCRAAQSLTPVGRRRINVRVQTLNNSLQENVAHPLSAVASFTLVWSCPEHTSSQASFCWVIRKSCELATLPIPQQLFMCLLSPCGKYKARLYKQVYTPVYPTGIHLPVYLVCGFCLLICFPTG